MSLQLTYFLNFDEFLHLSILPITQDVLHSDSINDKQLNVTLTFSPQKQIDIPSHRGQSFQ